MDLKTSSRVNNTSLQLLIVLALLISACGSATGSISRSTPQSSRPVPTSATTAGEGAAAVPTASDSVTVPAGDENKLEPAPSDREQPAPVAEVRQDDAQKPVVVPAEEKPVRPAARPAPAVSSPRTKPPVPPKQVKPQAPPREALSIPEPGRKYHLQLDIEGLVTYIYAKADGERHVVASEDARWVPGMFEKYVTLSPDNRTVTYAKAVQSRTDRMKLYLLDVDGSNQRLLLDLPWELWVAAPVWSPDSERIAYVRSASPGQKPGLELWVINADGTNNRKLLAHPSLHAGLFYGTVRKPLTWTRYGDVRYKDYQTDTVWTVNGQTGGLTSTQAEIDPPEATIPVVKTKHEIPIQSQNDPRWRYDFMKPQPNSLGSYGCVLTSVSMSFNAHGLPTDPKRLNKQMDKFAANFEWGYAEYVSDYKLDVSHQQWRFDWYALDLSLHRGWPALVWLADAFTIESATLTHWVLVVGGDGQTPSGYRIYDPWDGTTYKTLAYYTDKGYDLQKVYSYVPVPPKKAKPAKPGVDTPRSKKNGTKP
ncbi:MAG: C39 family peptidase [Chloroflexia bacterium]|nr:C39 family peptidase [Chloroflexia bacterium]